MATVTFFLQSKKNPANIYVSFSAAAKQVFKRKTRETVKPEYFAKGTIKNISSETKFVLDELDESRNKLLELRSFILKQYRDRKSSEIIDGDWLTEIIEAFYNGGRKIEQLDNFNNYLDYYKNNILPFRTYKNKPISKKTIEKQEVIISKLKLFVNTLNKNVNVSDYGLTMGNDFVTYLRGEGLADNTVGKCLKYSKTIVKGAISLGIQIHPTLNDIRGFTVKTPTLILTDDELENIFKLKISTNDLEITRDWFIIGINLGQRGGDLFSMTKQMIVRDLQGRDYIDFTQQKVPVYAKVPIHKDVKKILSKYNGNFPPLYTKNIESQLALFNENLKTIAKVAKLDRLDFGHTYDVKTKRNVVGMYPIHKLIASHICRRQFSSTYYGKIPTPVIMSVTGHKTETEFLKYIGKGQNELSEKMFDYWDKMEIDKALADTGQIESH